MLASFLEWPGLLAQFAGTAFLAALLTGAILLARHLMMHTEGYWFYSVGVAVLALLIFFPHGWQVIFGDNAPDWEALTERRVVISHLSLFKADFWGVVVGAIAAFGAALLLSERRGR